MKVYVDAKPKVACIVQVERTKQRSKFVELPKGLTHNEAEYYAIIIALEETEGDMELFSDSQLAVFQVNSLLDPLFKPFYRVREERMKPLAKQAVELVQARRDIGEQVELGWCPREENLAGLLLG